MIRKWKFLHILFKHNIDNVYSNVLYSYNTLIICNKFLCSQHQMTCYRASTVCWLCTWHYLYKRLQSSQSRGEGRITRNVDRCDHRVITKALWWQKYICVSWVRKCRLRETVIVVILQWVTRSSQTTCSQDQSSFGMLKMSGAHLFACSHTKASDMLYKRSSHYFACTTKKGDAWHTGTFLLFQGLFLFSNVSSLTKRKHWR